MSRFDKLCMADIWVFIACLIIPEIMMFLNSFKLGSVEGHIWIMIVIAYGTLDCIFKVLFTLFKIINIMLIMHYVWFAVTSIRSWIQRRSHKC